MTTRFQNNGLCLVQPGMQLRLQWIPLPIAEQKLEGGPWTPTLPDYRLFVPENCRYRPEYVFRVGLPHASHTEGDDQAWDCFWATVPADYRTRVDRFPSHQWALLALLQKEAAFRDLAAANLTLAYALANNHEMRGTAIGTSALQAIRYSHGKQRTILGFLGFPSQESVVNLFKKILPESATPTVLRLLRVALADGEVPLKLLNHLSEISAGALILASEPKLAGLITTDLVAEVAASEEERYEARAVTVLMDILRMRKEVGMNRTLPPIHSLARAKAVHDEMLLELQAFEARLALEARRAAREEQRLARALRVAQLQKAMKSRPKAVFLFPDPPIPGNKNILPLRSGAELRLEGLSQKHCVSAYTDEVLGGRKFIYKMLKPERATIEVARADLKSDWFLRQIRIKCNKTPQGATIRAAYQWFDAFHVRQQKT
jgi:hypothetical protein